MRLYFKYFNMHLRSAMQYKTSFALTAVGQFMTSFSVFIGIYFMFRRFGTVGGYTFEETLICYAAVLFAFTASECFFRGFDAFPSIISNGEFDRAMVRPRPVMLQVLCSRIEFARIGRFLQAAVILTYAIPKSGVIWTPLKALTLVLMCVGGTALFAGLFIIYAGICFFTIEGLEFMNVFTDGGRELGKYPIDIYGSAVLRFYTFIIPLACVQYYPFTYIIGRSSSFFYVLLPLAAFVFLIPCRAVWRFGVRHYKSTGS
ncbi:MAG: ABC transporter permease [Eubacteriales bacterium]